MFEQFSRGIFLLLQLPPLPSSTLRGQYECQVSYWCSWTALVFLSNTPQHLPLQPRLILLIQTSLHPGVHTLLNRHDALEGFLPPSCPAALDLLSPSSRHQCPPTFSPLPGAAQVPPSPAYSHLSPHSPFYLLPFILH